MNNELPSNATDFNTIEKAAVVLAAGTLAFGGIAIAKAMMPDYESPSDLEKFNPQVTSIEIADDARIREEPAVADDPSNVLVTTDERFVFPLDHGAKHINDQNGDWYGLSIDDIKKTDAKFAKELKSDDDGVVWVNGQRADITENIDQTSK